MVDVPTNTAHVTATLKNHPPIATQVDESRHIAVIKNTTEPHPRNMIAVKMMNVILVVPATHPSTMITIAAENIRINEIIRKVSTHLLKKKKSVSQSTILSRPFSL